ncbi:Alpha/Beta hydrolase protein [Plectosphaerella plurivora]|uniref:Alpha/Beta hydrolase protein n=1 Tax=Plectosphaerella plurivora TaxID=936078 RepID=A0A9P8VEI3_9PEZI|nr:Alpha/Beta hydrolase protein [Plectosphaerella plurivora]
MPQSVQNTTPGVLYTPDTSAQVGPFPAKPSPLTIATDILSRLLAVTVAPRDVALVSTTVVGTLFVFFLLRYVLYPKWRKVIPSPMRASFPKVSPESLAKQVYHPEVLPGARDVRTPYGTIRVYEFGNQNGPKVLMIHGISTPCITLAPLAESLASRGCRVMVLDLFGRGFSDGVGDLPHDERLYTTNILLALASSPLPWTGDRAFKLIGYSLGGALAASFATTFPNLIDSLVLLAPAGLIRAADFGIVARVMFRSGLVPERLLAMATKKRLQRPIAATAKPRARPSLKQETSATEQIAEIAVSETSAAMVPPEETPLEIRVDEYVRWMVVHHAGFVPAFMSCIRHAPLTDQHETWETLGKVMGPGRVAVLLGEKDEIVDWCDYERDGLPLLGGHERVHWKVLGGSHDFVMTHTDDILREMKAAWTMGATEPGHRCRHLKGRSTAPVSA